MALDLSECWAKIDRAYEHLDSLEAVAGGGFQNESKQIQLRAKFDPETGYYVLSIATLPEAWRIQAGLILGDLVHNLRSALDYLFWRLFWEHVTSVTPATIPDGTANKIQFPIKDKAKAFNSFRREGPFNKIPLRSWAILNTAQPYKRRHVNRRFLGLGGLRDLSNRDKHRVLTPFFDWSTEWDFARGGFRGYQIVETDLLPGRRLEIGAKVVRVRLATPHPDAEVEVAGYLDPIAHLPIPDTKGTWAVDLFQALDCIFDEVERVVETIERLHSASP